MLAFVRRLILAAAVALPLVGACSDSRPITALHDGLPECDEIGELCHEPGEKLGGFYEECHETGHVREGKACLEIYDDCIAQCSAAVEAGFGGEGGAMQAQAGAGGDGPGGQGGAAGR